MTDETWSALLALQRATHATLHLLAAELAGLGLSASEMNVLANLADGRARTIRELGVAAGTRPTTLTSVLDRLERRELLARGPRPGDRRAVEVRLTAAGREAAATIRRAISGLEERALGGFSEEAVAGLREGLQALAEGGDHRRRGPG
ncbi:MarR family transcriptional regulator [Nonomuraea sp. NPDC050310]|uniref:MarR family winged helix-turn-helix transcriptional regulator n=1 Tax=unclassified Nonomuraea TaxID=2593643 RepID=UPI0033F434A0